jgi:nicotinamidase-related amidase
VDRTVELDPRQTALVVVDMQNDFCSDHGYYAGTGFDTSQVRSVVQRLSRVIAAIRESGATVVYTRLVHDPAVPDVMDRHAILPPGWRATERRLVPGTWGSEIVDELRPAPGEAIVDKSGYSAFADTGLASSLRRRGVRTVVLCGTIDYACVLHTAFDAFELDFDVLLARECTSGWDVELGAAARRIVELLLGRLIDDAALLAALGVSPAEPAARP